MTRSRASAVRRAAGLVAASMVHAALVAAVPLMTEGARANLATPRTALFFAILTGWFLSESTIAPADLRPHPWRWRDQVTAPLLLVVFWMALMQQGSHSPFPHMAASGAVLMVLGAAVRVLAIRELGEQFLDDTEGMPDQLLVTGGIYGVMRHPSEFGVLCLAVGASVLCASTGGIVLTAAALLPAVLRRVQAEDRALAEVHGTSFTRYVLTVPALYPRLRPRALSGDRPRTDLDESRYSRLSRTQAWHPSESN